MIFDGASAIDSYLPATGTAGVLTADLFDPTTTPSGMFGGDVLALRLDVDFADAGFLVGVSGISFGNVVLADLTGSDAVANGLTVRQFLADANACLGGGVCIESVGNVDLLTLALTFAFEGGLPDAFAQNFLIPPTAAPIPEPVDDAAPDTRRSRCGKDQAKLCGDCASLPEAPEEPTIDGDDEVSKATDV